MIFDTNAANAFTLALTNLNITLAAEREKRKIVNYSIFSKRGNKDINDFIIELEKAFVMNRVPDNRKHIVIASCLKGIVANFYDELVVYAWKIDQLNLSM